MMLTAGEKTSLALPFNLIKRHLREVEKVITQQADAFDPDVVDYVAYAVQSKGKRLRPALTLLTAGATGGMRAEHVDLAVILELIHLATLIHDDIIDEAVMRRDQPTANAKWGNATSVLLGDCLFAHALKLSTQFEDASVCRSIAQATSMVCSGEIIQTRRRHDWNLPLEEYFRVIEMKTAALFIAASELSAKLNECPDEIVAACRQFGRELGIAYQIYDDCLDVAGSESTVGKTLRTDLLKGKLTLPILKLLDASNDLQHAEICQKLGHGDAAGAEEVAKLALDRGFVSEAIQDAGALVRRAQSQLEVLPASEYRDALVAIGNVLLGLLQRLDPSAANPA